MIKGLCHLNSFNIENAWNNFNKITIFYNLYLSVYTFFARFSYIEQLKICSILKYNNLFNFGWAFLS